MIPDQAPFRPVIGQTTLFARTITDADVALFALVTGDQHPLHLDVDYAATTHFGHRVIPAMLIGGIIEAALVEALPGVSGIANRQSLSFPTPAFVDEAAEIMVSVVLIVREMSVDGRRVTYGVRATGADDVLIATGEVECLLEDLPPFIIGEVA